MQEDRATRQAERDRLRRVAFRVIVVQVVTLLVLWWLEATYAVGVR